MKSVLIVDDDYDVRDSLQDILEDEGFTVVATADGLEAIEYLRVNPPPGVILLDWMMPRCDGAQFRSVLDADPALARIPVVLLTADARVRHRLHRAESQEILLKPVKLTQLLEVIYKHCRSPH